jgi:hypothetical protein
MVRATNSGSSTIGVWPTLGRILKVARGRRSRATFPYVATGNSESFSDHARLIGHGRGVQRGDLVVVVNLVDVDGARDDVPENLDGPGRG